MSNEHFNEKKEPLIHIVRRAGLPLPKKILVYVAATVLGLLISSLICVAFAPGHSPIEYFSTMFNGAFGSERKVWLLLQDMALLLGVAVALVPAFKMKFWNLGGNGQVLAGCLASIACMYYLGTKTGGAVPDPIIIICMLISSVLAGVLFAILPAIFKALFGTNESLFTLMMNYIAEGLVAMFITIWVKSGSGVLTPITYGNIPAIGNNYLLTIILFFSLAIGMHFYLRYSKHGYELTVVGESVNTAKYVGINVKKVIMRTMILSGAIAGLVGFVIAGSIQHTVSISAHNNLGFTAIMVAWLAEFNPLIMFVSSFFITFVSKGMNQVRRDFGFNDSSVANTVIGIIYFCVIACSFFINYKVVFRQKKKPAEVAAKKED